MTKGLDNQIYTYSVDTSAFYTKEEDAIHLSIMEESLKRNKIKNSIEKLKNEEEINTQRELLKSINQNIAHLKGKLRDQFKLKLDTRELNPTQLNDSNAISIFESTLSRVIGAKANELCLDIITVRAYHYEVLESLIKSGFILNGEQYVYFSSSAGQIRTKKGVWMKESTWLEHQNTIMCGLSVEEINSKGGSNINKYLSYMALASSATAIWEDFDIDRTIVVNDLETSVHSEVDYIDRDTYEITRKTMDIDIEHTDGCGMMLPSVGTKSFMTRLPFVKGLLSTFAFDEFIKEHNGSSNVIDIYGKEYDIFEDNIQIIFTKSQFKMWEYYDSWEDYKDRFKEYNCQASKLNEEDTRNDAMLNYQMFQTLTDMTDKELQAVCKSTNEDISKIGNCKDTMLKIMGATEHNEHKSHLQEALYMHPQLLNDAHVKKTIKDKKKSMVKAALSGKVNINGKYTFLIPDLYAFCEKLFLGIESPKGLLKDNEVYCKLFKQGKVDVLRSPHLYREHAVKNNKFNTKRNKWFTTEGVYTSVLDPISKMLQFDNDGDKALVVQDTIFIKVAERNMKGIVPLYYKMEKAKAVNINSNHIYDSLIMAFKANIGEISNRITKIWNSDDINLDVIKWLCMENNFEIDYAKTLYRLDRPDHIDKIITNSLKGKVPHFFIYAKDKEEENVEKINNSVVNRLVDTISNERIAFKRVAGKFDYNVLKSSTDSAIVESKDIINAYEHFNRNKQFLLSNYEGTKYSDSMLYIYKTLRGTLQAINDNTDEIVDILVEYLYKTRNTEYKTSLWEGFGDILVQNINKNTNCVLECSVCGSEFVRIKQRQSKCTSCLKEAEREKERIKKRKKRMSPSSF